MEPQTDATLGLFGIRDNSDERDLSLDERFVPNKTATFFFKMRGHAMEPLIRDGDVLVVDRGRDLVHNKVIVCSYQGQFLCRRFEQRSSLQKLVSDHRSHRDLVIKEQDDFVFFGQVTALVREQL